MQAVEGSSLDKHFCRCEWKGLGSQAAEEENEVDTQAKATKRSYAAQERA